VFVLREWYEPELRYLESTLSAGMVVIDGGANLGIYTVLASALVGDEGLVLSFEPGETSFRNLEQNIALNGAQNVRPFKLALADTSGTRRLYHTRGGPVGYSLSTDEGVMTPYEIVQTTTIDDTLAAQGIDRVDVLKLDVEGAEELALVGAGRLLESSRPIVLFEMQPHAPIASGLQYDGAWTLLRRLGYTLFTVSDDGELVPGASPRIGNNLALPSAAGQA
jgi:FkbM family methyltransferase